MTARSLAAALEMIAEEAERHASVNYGVASQRAAMRQWAFALRTLALSAPDRAVGEADSAEPDDLDRFIRERAAQDPAFAAEYVQAQHAATVRTHEDLLAILWLHIGRYEVKQLTTGQKNLLADSVDAANARLAEADPTYGEPAKVERWWIDD